MKDEIDFISSPMPSCPRLFEPHPNTWHSLVTAKQCLLVPDMKTISHPISSSTTEKSSVLLPFSTLDEKTRPFELRTTTNLSQQAILDAFSLFGRETAVNFDPGDLIIEKRLMKMTSPLLLIAATCLQPPKSATGS